MCAQSARSADTLAYSTTHHPAAVCWSTWSKDVVTQFISLLAARAELLAQTCATPEEGPYPGGLWARISFETDPAARRFLDKRLLLG